MKARSPGGDALGEAAEWEDKGFKFGVGGQKIRGARKPGPIQLHLLMKDDEGQPHANEAFEIRGPGVSIKGTTTKDGYVDAEIPVGAEEAVLTVGGDKVSLFFQKREPLTTPMGLQQALLTLGYEVEPTGALDDKTEAAVKALQEDENLKVTGKADDALRKRIQALLAAV